MNDVPDAGRYGADACTKANTGIELEIIGGDEIIIDDNIILL